MLTLLNTPCSKNGPFIAIPVLAQEKTYFKSNDSYVTRILTRMPIAQRGRVMAPASDQLNARFLRRPSVYPCTRVLLVMDQGRPAIEFGATDTLPPYTFSRTDTRRDQKR